MFLTLYGHPSFRQGLIKFSQQRTSSFLAPNQPPLPLPEPCPSPAGISASDLVGIISFLLFFNLNPGVFVSF